MVTYTELKTYKSVVRYASVALVIFNWLTVITNYELSGVNADML